MSAAPPRRPGIQATALALAALLLLAAGSAAARQFRLLLPIATPEQATPLLPEGARPVPTVIPVGRDQVEPLVRELLESWNTAGLADKLAEEFWDSQRLLNALDTRAPRDASLRLQAVQGLQTLAQYLQTDPATGTETRVSIVSATVRTQLEFNAPGTGFVRRTGLNEYLLKISHPESP